VNLLIELLSIFLVKENTCQGTEMKIFDKVIICASWSDGPFIRGCTEKSCL